MPAPYSADLRQRVLAACKDPTLTRAEVARRFQISEPTVYNWLQQERDEGRRSAKPHNGGPQRTLGAAAEDVLRELVEEENDRTLAEYNRRLRERGGVQVSDSTISRALSRLGLVRKKRRSEPVNRSARM